MPYISAKYRSTALWNRMRAAFMNMPILDTGGRYIDLAPWPESVDDDGVMHFKDTGRPESERMKEIVVKPDVVILASGYTRRFDFLDQTYPAPATGDVRRIYNRDEVSIAYIGFVRPSLGAIPPLAEMQAQLWVLRLIQAAHPSGGGKARDQDAVPAYELEYALKPRGGRDLFQERNGVDHESYVYQLALDMGSAPTLTFVLRQGFKVLWTWAMGSNFNTKFRLVGPWKDKGPALDIMRGELLNVTKRLAGIPFFVVYTLAPFIVFGAMSVALYFWDWLKGKFSSKKRT
jgi:dimethylaniline monooxygenase (N-oxide forming)